MLLLWRGSAFSFPLCRADSHPQDPPGASAQRAPWSMVGLALISDQLSAPDLSRCPIAAITCLLGLFCGHQVRVVRTANTSLHRSRPPCPSRLHKEPTLCNSPPHLPCTLGTPATLSSAACGLPEPTLHQGSHRSSWRSSDHGSSSSAGHAGPESLSSLLSLPQGDRPPLRARGGTFLPLAPGAPRLADPRGGQGETMSQISCFLGVTGQGIGPPAGQLGPRNPGSTPSSAAHAL